MNFLTQLETLGLNGRQSKVYLALLQLGSAGAIELAKYTGLKNPTVYDVLEILKQKGLVAESASGGRKRFQAEPPSRLEEVEASRRRALDEILPDLEALYREGGKRPVIRFYQGEDCVVAHDDVLKTREGQYFYFGTVREMFRLSTEEYLQRFFRRRIAAGIWSNGIRTADEDNLCDYMEPGEGNLRRTRYLPLDWGDGIAGIYMYDNKVNIHSSYKENFAVIIESPQLYRALKTLWRCLWCVSGRTPEEGAAFAERALQEFPFDSPQTPKSGADTLTMFG